MISQYFVLLLTIFVLIFLQVNCNNTSRVDSSGIGQECSKVYNSTCLKLRIAYWMNEMNEIDSVDLLPGLSVIREIENDRKNISDTVAELARHFPKDVEARLDMFLIKKLKEFLSSHSIRVNPWQNKQIVESTRQNAGGAGGAAGGGGGGGILLAAGGLMKGTLLILALGGLVAIAGKALITGLISLVLSSIIGLKSLTNHHKKTTYEIVGTPIYSHSNAHTSSSGDYGHGGYSQSYGRNFDVPFLPGLHTKYRPK
ncbi:hypothetical protein WA026_008494 [Henosepilachna vigintioctopunctata]|uniref:Uncharacterized protein n=1 Tax=Henosepilachna vigintioctopunctata TaxID=420089 RepID=A0AAW1UBS8_9CUCU